jgi:4-hydroxybenzoate polyprenyltransferase
MCLNWYAIGMGVLSLGLIAAYPFMKRITWWPQAWLGLTFNWGALLGFAAQSGRTTAADLVLYAGCVFWTLGYDTIYALQDVEDDALAGVKSTARLFNKHTRTWIFLFYLMSFALIAAAAGYGLRSWIPVALLIPSFAHLLWQVRRLEIDSPDVSLRLFRANRETGALIAAAFVAGSWFA